MSGFIKVKNGFTDGPWRAQEHSLGFSVFGPYDPEEEASPWIAADLSEANARLIAAAPDLLEAAKLAESVMSNMAKILDYHPEGGTAVPRLQAAIAKAEGR